MITGADYIRRIDQLNPDVWVDGHQIDGKISEHPAFKGVMNSQAKLYDIQHQEAIKDTMTYISPETNDRVGISFLIPKTKEDLILRRSMTQEWAKTSAGMMGRSPDYMNTILTSFAASKHLLEGQKNCFPNNLYSFYKKAREEDLTFTHTFINPQVNRSRFKIIENTDDIIAAKIVDRNQEGIVVKGAKLLATQGGMTDEILIYSTPGVIDSSYSYSFSIPSNTKGLKFICREPFCHKDSTFDFPLSSQFEEPDSIVVLDEVLVPWERVFYYDNVEIADQFKRKGAYTQLTLHQVVSRQVVKMEFVLGVAQLIVDTINTSDYEHVPCKISEIIVALETMKAFLISSEEKATKDEHGVMLPSINPLFAAINTFSKVYPRMTEILELLGASGMVLIPTENDFKSDIRDDLDQYLQANYRDAISRVKLFRLARDICMSAFGTRQTLYERFFFGDPMRLSNQLYTDYDREHLKQRVEELFLK